MRTVLHALALGILLTACTTARTPEIQFLGITAGDEATKVEDLRFGDRFTVDQTNLMAIVSLKNIDDGAVVEATWFSPDERSMPIGRTAIPTESGATIARFTFASKVRWTPSPYMLHLEVRSGEGDNMRTTSQDLHFFIGMTDEEVKEYQKEYEEAKNEGGDVVR